MQTLLEIKKEREDKQTELFENCGLFFCFSNEQFKENKTPLTEGDKYVSIGAGGYLPKTKVDTFLNGMETLRKWYAAQINQTKKMRYDEIAYQLSNHEAYYTGSIDDAIMALGEGYTAKEVSKVYNSEKNKQLN